MKYSIKRQLAMICAAMIAGTIILCYVLNSFFLENYYINKKKNALKDAYGSVNAASNEGSIASDDFDAEIRRICNKYNLDMIVMDEKTSTVKSSENNSKPMVDRLLQNLFEEENPVDRAGLSVLEKQDRYTIHIRKNDENDEDYLEMWGLLDTGNLFLIRSSLEGIRDSVSIANSFLAYAGLFSIIFSIIISTLISDKITKPIMALAAVSSKMKKLDFSAKYSGDSKNEIAILGQNINELSEELEKTISELKTANNQLQTDLDKKTEIDEMRKEFISNVSHELKTPIALIQGYAEGLSEGITDDPESMAFYCEVISDEANKMNRLVKELLALNQLEAGTEPVQMERFDIVVMINNIIKSNLLLAEQKKISIEGILPDSLFVWGDEFRIQEVLTNYLSNAMNHVSDSGVIKVVANNEESRVRIAVFNTGESIPEDSVPYIWDKFYKVDKARTREYGGSGIGLSIVKAIMESMHGAYGVNNKEDGVEFWFELEQA